MKLEHLTNRSASSLQSELIAQFENAREFAIATAFINEEAIDIIEDSLKRKHPPISGRLLTGLYSYFNKKKDLERLLALTNKHPDKLQVHISLDRCFHWKYYQFKDSRQQIFYIGSANFTTGGMADNRELVVKLSDTVKSGDRALNNLAVSFDKEWLHSRPLAEFPLKHYREAELPKFPKGAGSKEINDFFNHKATAKNVRAGNGKTYAVGLYKDASPATYQAIENQKGEWVKNDWDWFALPTRRLFDSCKQHSDVFVFSKEGRDEVYCRYSRIVDDAENIKTPDGNYFIAHKPVKCIKLVRAQQETLRRLPIEIDLIGWKEPFYTRSLSQKQMVAIKELLGFKKYNHST